uniref:PDZ domain-containing protein n=1 Tax=Hemiselmis tepida TaxID=464990 RepID=A0A7S0VUG2_9CRYP|mmetsp:Transcript_28260/g.71581  ORF Transcript_28260/g.71581 Transcript_28260/m.71581 type:complete len:124 (+) Transcript_28260:163-534(+)
MGSQTPALPTPPPKKSRAASRGRSGGLLTPRRTPPGPRAGEGKGLRVNHIKPGSSADKSYRIKQDDRLCSIDHEDVRWHSAGQIAPLILGAAGTRVRLGFERPGTPTIPFEVVLTRGTGTGSI